MISTSRSPRATPLGRWGDLEPAVPTDAEGQAARRHESAVRGLTVMVLSTNCLPAGIASVSLLLVGCGCDVARTDLPQVVAPDRPDTLSTEPVPTTLDQALGALNRGLSGADFAAIRLLDEDDAVESTYRVALWVQGRWGLASDGG